LPDSASLTEKELRRLRADIVMATRRFGGPAGFAAMNQALNVVEPVLVRAIRTAVKIRSGTLWKSVRRKVTRGAAAKIPGIAPADARLPVGIVGPSAIYGATHELGGTIRPVRARALAIPLDAAKTAAGVSRGGPRSYSDLFLVKGKGGKPILVRDIGGGRLKAFFALRSSVRVPARPFAKPTAEKTSQRVAAILGDAFVVGFKRTRTRT